MRLCFFILIFTFKAVSGQPISFNNEKIDSVIIKSYVSSFQFDDKGTTKGRRSFFVITYDSEQANYKISEYIKESFTYTYRPEAEEIKHQTIKKQIGDTVSRNTLTDLSIALSTTEFPDKSNISSIPELIDKYVNEKNIRKVAKWYESQWYFRPKYSSRDENKELFEAPQSADTFNLYLKERFKITPYIYITDYSNFITIRLISTDSSYLFEGSFPQPLKQPWYDQTTPEILDTITLLTNPHPVLNLNINFMLEKLLPDEFLLKNSISSSALMYDYLSWYLARRDVIYDNNF